jgi:Transposase DNA-binding/Transposase DDE domain
MSDPLGRMLNMDSAQTESEWASEEFGLAQLGDVRRMRRLVQVAAAVANQPAGQVTAVFECSADREGAFRLLENDAVSPEAVAYASHRACARRTAGAEFVYVSVDGSSLNLTDNQQQKGLGHIGSCSNGARGLKTMSALAVRRDGTPLGLCGQKYWAREEKKKGSKRKLRKRPVKEKETQHWLDVMEQVRRVFEREAPQTKPWFQLDREGDAWPILLDGLKPGELFTVRAAQNRKLTGDEKRYLWETLEAKRPLGRMELALAARPARKPEKGKQRPARKARTAQIELRAGRLSLELRVGKARRAHVPLFALLASETAASAGDEEPVEWLLLTSRPIETVADAQLVLFGYSQRWRIEEFHKCWKSGACKVEHTQLRERDNIARWATVLAAVATRILRLTYLARTSPDLPALEELRQAEIDVIVLGSRSEKYQPGSVPPIGELVQMLARIGGYTGKSSGGPPGPLVLARGLYKIEFAADMFDLGIFKPA